jgi:hypothetical protein
VAQIFSHTTDKIIKGAGLLAPLGLIGVVAAISYWWSPSFTDVGYQPEQPVPFSHKLHAGDLGLDCRYCHSTVELGASASVPPTQTCMNCHGFVATDSKDLAPVRASWESGNPVEWTRVHMLPDYSYFDHSIHVSVGVGCASCHGRIDHMETVYQSEPLSMGWCLNCHRNPEPHLRPLNEVTNMAYDPAASGYDPAADPERTRELSPPLHCSGCHR